MSADISGTRYFLEIANRAGDVIARAPLDTLPVRIGRALDNDFVVDDGYIAAHHLQIEASDATGRFVARDLGTRNALLRGRQRVGEATLGAGDTLDFGHSSLRIRSTDEVLPPERSDEFRSRAFSLGTALGLIATVMLFELGNLYFSQTGRIAFSHWLMLLLGLGATIVVWSGLWAMVSRVFGGRTHFVTHLAITSWLLLFIDLGDLLFPLLAFALAAPVLALGAETVTGLALFWALRQQIGLAQPRWRRAVAPVALLTVAVPALLWFANTWEEDHRLLAADTLPQLYDPALRLSADKSLDQFIERGTALKLAADAVRDVRNDDDSLDEEAAQESE